MPAAATAALPRAAAGDKVVVYGSAVTGVSNSITVITFNVTDKAPPPKDVVIGKNVVALSSITYLVTTCGMSPPMDLTVSTE